MCGLVRFHFAGGALPHRGLRRSALGPQARRPLRPRRRAGPPRRARLGSSQGGLLPRRARQQEVQSHARPRRDERRDLPAHPSLRRIPLAACAWQGRSGRHALRDVAARAAHVLPPPRPAHLHGRGHRRRAGPAQGGPESQDAALQWQRRAGADGRVRGLSATPGADGSGVPRVQGPVESEW